MSLALFDRLMQAHEVAEEGEQPCLLIGLRQLAPALTAIRDPEAIVVDPNGVIHLTSLSSVTLDWRYAPEPDSGWMPLGDFENRGKEAPDEGEGPL